MNVSDHFPKIFEDSRIIPKITENDLVIFPLSQKKKKKTHFTRHLQRRVNPLLKQATTSRSDLLPRRNTLGHHHHHHLHLITVSQSCTKNGRPANRANSLNNIT